MQLAIYGRSVQQLARDCASRPRWILSRSSVLQPDPDVTILPSSRTYKYRYLLSIPYPGASLRRHSVAMMIAKRISWAFTPHPGDGSFHDGRVTCADESRVGFPYIVSECHLYWVYRRLHRCPFHIHPGSCLHQHSVSIYETHFLGEPVVKPPTESTCFYI